MVGSCIFATIHRARARDTLVAFNPALNPLDFPIESHGETSFRSLDGWSLEFLNETDTISISFHAGCSLTKLKRQQSLTNIMSMRPLTSIEILRYLRST